MIGTIDRKKLIRQYKETPRLMGVFHVLNTAEAKSFVGLSRDLPSMLNRQRFQLEHGSHPNHALQMDWNRLGPAGFIFEILDTLIPSKEPGHDPSEDLHVLEQLWLEKLLPYGERGYNTGPKSSSGSAT